MKVFYKVSLAIVVFIISYQNSNAQNFAERNKAKLAKADSLAASYELAPDTLTLEEALDIYLVLVKEEKAEAKPDTAAIIHSEFQIGYLDMLNGQYRWGMQAFERMFRYVKRPRDYDIINRAIPYLGFCYRQTRIENFIFDLPKFPSTKRREFYFPISRVWDKENDTVVVKINFGTYDGIGLGAFGKAIGVKTDLIYGHNNQWLGYCEVTDIAESQAVLKIFNMPEWTDSTKMIFENDMVRLPIQFPTRFTDALTLAIMNNIIFYNIDGYHFYDYRQWYMHGNDTLKNDIISAMEYDIHRGYEKYKESDLDVLKQVCKSGRYKDKTLLEVLKITTQKDVRDFLSYATFFNVSYFGKRSFLSKYADWVLDDCPMSYGEFFDALEESKTKSDLVLIANKFKESAEKDEDYFNNLGNDEEELASLGLKAKAFELNEKQRQVAALMNMSGQVGWSYFFKARMHDLYDEHDSVIKAYNNAIIFFKKANDLRGESYSIGNLASKYYELDDYKKSLEFYSKSYELKLKTPITDSSTYYKGLAIALHGRGDNYYITNEFDLALKDYMLATLYYNRANSVDARSRSLTAYSKIAKILKKQGKYREALQAYQSQQMRYKQLGDQVYVAEIYDEQADVLFSLNEYEKSAEYYTIAAKMKLSWQDYSGAGFSVSAVGQALYNLGEFDKAIQAHDSAIKLRNLGNDQYGVAYSLSQIGSLYKENGDFTKASYYFDEAYKLYKTLGYDSKLANINSRRGNLEQKLLNYSKALEYYKSALELFIKLNDKIEVGNMYYNISSVYNSQNKFSLSLAYADSALRVQQETGDQSGQMYTLNYIGSITQISTNKTTKALEYYEKALVLARATGSPYNVAVCLASIGSAYSNMGLIAKSKPYLDSCHQIYVSIKDRLQQCYSLVNIGYYHVNMGNFTEAGKKFNESLKLAIEIKNNGAIASAYSALGGIGRVTGEFDSSISYLNKSVKLYEKSDNAWGIASSYIEIGNLYNMLSKNDVAVNYYMRADSIYHSINNEYYRSTPLNNAGTLFYHQGNYDSSLTYYFPALEILKKYETESEFINLLAINIGDVYTEKAEYAEAEKWLKLGLENSMKREDKRNKGIALRIMAKYKIARQKYEEARVHAFEAYKIIGDSGEIENTTDIYNQIGRSNYELKDYKTAIDWYAKTIKKSEPIHFMKFLYEAYFYSALSYYKLGRKDSAVRQLRRAIELVEEISARVTGGSQAKKMFASGNVQQKMFETMVGWLLEDGKIEEALIYLEKGNNEALNTKFKQLRGNLKDVNSETYKSLKEAEEKQAALDKINSELIKEKSKPADQQKTELIKKLEEIQQVSQKQYDKFFSNLVKTNSKINLYLSNSVNPADFKAEKANISADMAVLLYMMAEENLYIFCATHDSVFAKIIPIKSVDLSKKIATMYDLVKNPGFLPTTRRGTKTPNIPKIDNPEKTLNDVSQELYSILIGSVKKEIGNKTRLAIIPNGDLFILPFQALIAKKEDNKITYLMDEFKVQYSNRLKFIGSKQTVDLADLRICIIGNPDKSLPGAELEVKNIKVTFPEAYIMIGDKATKAQLVSISENYNVLHLATHGIVNAYHFDSSYLVMAPDPKNNDDGRLTIDDIGNIPGIENYSLVILSACETNVKSDLTEGYPQSTAIAFIKAGVETVFASLWQVDDRSTQPLMNSFFENLKTNPNKRTALQDAQIAVSKMPNFSHPYYWAPFIYMGE